VAEEDVDFHPLLKEEANLKSLHEVSWSSEAPKAVKGEAEAESGQ
jgi:hypothetical protein